MHLTKKEFKIWLLQNNHTQKTLAQKLGLSDVTISTYNKNERYPIMFVMSLKYLEMMQGE
jgi:DNA-binding XRE family transcriptional regulator